MPAFKLNLVIDQGATFTKEVTWKTGTPTSSTAVDLTGCTARMQIRESVEEEAVLIELTTENGRITLGDELGTVSMFVEADDTAALDFIAGVYDLEIVFADGRVRRLVAGTVKLSKEVTRGG